MESAKKMSSKKKKRLEKYIVSRHNFVNLSYKTSLTEEFFTGEKN